MAERLGSRDSFFAPAKLNVEKRGREMRKSEERQRKAEKKAAKDAREQAEARNND